MSDRPQDPEQREIGEELSERERAEREAEFAERREPLIIDPRTHEVLGTVSSFSWEEFYSGPLPSPQQLNEYNQVSAGLGDRIVSEWQAEGSHRRSLEKGALRGQLRAQSRGQLLGALICLVVIFGGIALLFADKRVEGLVTILAPLAILAGVFVVVEQQGRRASDLDRIQIGDDEGVRRASRQQLERRPS